MPIFCSWNNNALLFCTCKKDVTGKKISNIALKCQQFYALVIIKEVGQLNNIAIPTKVTNGFLLLLLT